MVTATYWGTFDEALDAIRVQLPDVTLVLDRTLANAVHGDRGAASRYVAAYVRLVDTFANELPTDRAEQRMVATLARREAISLPFRARLVDDRVGVSLTVALLADVRDLTSVATPLRWPEPRPGPLRERLDVTDRDVRQFEQLVDRLLDRRAARHPLDEVIATFDLSNTDAGRLFGVSRQAVSQWFDDRVPPERAAKVATVAQTATLLRHHLLADRIPGVARKPAEAYGGVSMLDMIEADRHDELLERTRTSFDWAASA